MIYVYICYNPKETLDKTDSSNAFPDLFYQVLGMRKLCHSHILI